MYYGEKDFMEDNQATRLMLHGCSNKIMYKGSMKKWKPERTNITEKGRKSNEQGTKDLIK